MLKAGLADPALTAMAEIVHDVDLKDGKFAREEAGGIAHLVTGLCTSNKEDDARIERGGAVFDDLYAALQPAARVSFVRGCRGFMPTFIPKMNSGHRCGSYPSSLSLCR